MPLCLKKTERKSKDGSSSNENDKDDKSKMMSGSKDLCGDSTRKRNDEKAILKRCYVYRATEEVVSGGHVRDMLLWLWAR